MPVDKIINHWTLLGFNLFLIVIIEITGTFFVDTGLVHLIAIIFVALAFIRAATHPHVYDQFLEPLLHRGILAFVVLALSHVVEFAGFMIIMLPRATIASNVVNFYLAALLVVISGIEIFTGKLKRSSPLIPPGLMFLAIILVLLVAVFHLRPSLVSLEPNSWMMYVYSGAVVIITSIGIWRLQVLKKHVPIMVNFNNYFTAGFIMIGLSALFSTLEVVITSTGISFLQLVYMNHFLFYGALSLIYLAYDRLLHLGGVYDELRKEMT